MKFYCFLLPLILLSAISVAQPVWSPEVRAERENKWMKDSLQLRPEKLKKAYDISLSYYKQLDQVAQMRNRKKMQQRIMNKKDAMMKPMLTREQFLIYDRREKVLRKALDVKYTGPHQPN